VTGIEIALVASGVALLLLAAFAAAVETVVTRMNLVRALRLDEEEQRGAASLLWLLEHRATVLDALMLATVVGRIAFAAIAVDLGLRLDGGPGGVVLAVAVAALLSLVVGEVLPRTVALRHLESTGQALGRPARVVVRILDPLSRIVVALGRVLVPRRHEMSGPHASDDELRQLDADEEEQDDELEPEERAMIRSIFELADTIVREIMVPRPDMVTVSEQASLNEVIGLVLDRGFSRVPVHDAEDPDVVIGVVYAKDLLRRIALGQRSGRWGDLVRSPTYVPETKRVDELLRDLQAAAVHLAIVVDEYGEIVGLATIEDILEEIVGEIVDEHDQEQALVEPLDDGGLRVDARLGVDDLNEILDAALPEDGWDTVGGLVFGTLGRVPVEGESIELDGIVITIERVQGRRVGKVLVTQASVSDDDQAPADDQRDGDPVVTDDTTTKVTR
jgi:CBS domain containing-hemolysin-like protein